jgi:hypothetical protein
MMHRGAPAHREKCQGSFIPLAEPTRVNGPTLGAASIAPPSMQTFLKPAVVKNKKKTIFFSGGDPGMSPFFLCLKM